MQQPEESRIKVCAGDATSHRTQVSSAVPAVRREGMLSHRTRLWDPLSKAKCSFSHPLLKIPISPVQIQWWIIKKRAYILNARTEVHLMRIIHLCICFSTRDSANLCRCPCIYEFWGANTRVTKYSNNIESRLILLTALCYLCSHNLSHVCMINLSQTNGSSIKFQAFSCRDAFRCPVASSHIGTHFSHSLTPRKTCRSNKTSSKCILCNIKRGAFLAYGGRLKPF